MSKYNSLWEFIGQNESDAFKLTFEKICGIAGTPIDHSFLKYKKRTYRIRLSGRENIHERANRYI